MYSGLDQSPRTRIYACQSPEVALTPRVERPSSSPLRCLIPTLKRSFSTPLLMGGCFGDFGPMVASTPTRPCHRLPTCIWYKGGFTLGSKAEKLQCPKILLGWEQQIWTNGYYTTVWVQTMKKWSGGNVSSFSTKSWWSQPKKVFLLVQETNIQVFVQLWVQKWYLNVP